jgi:hypothetical protein
MSSRSRGARDLADLLSDKVGVDVRIGWENPSGRPGHGAWLVEWRDGPAVATMRGHAEDLAARYCRPLTIAMLRFSRFRSDQAQTAAMLALAHHGELPELPALACLAADRELADTDTATWAHLWAHLWAQAGQLVEQADGDLYEVVALIHATVTKPRHETPPEPPRPSHDPDGDAPPGACQHCAAPLAPPGRAGRPGRYCGPACRQAAHRAGIGGDVTKPRHETTCVTCGRTFTPTSVGRPPRHCSPACRTRAWRHTKGTSH